MCLERYINRTVVKGKNERTIKGKIMQRKIKRKEQSRKEDKDPLMVERGVRLKALRKALRFSRPALHEKYGIKPSTLKNWEDGRFGGLRESCAWEMIEIFRNEGIICSIEWLLLGLGAPPLPGLMREDRASTSVEIRFIHDELQLFRKNHLQTVDVIIPDDTMEPCYKAGEHVAGIRYFVSMVTPNTEKKILEWPCIVQTTSGEILVRLVEKSNLPGYYRLYTYIDEKMKAPELELFSIAPILWSRRKNPLAE